VESIRSFLALELGFYFKDDIARVINKLKTSSAKIKWIKPEIAHITLHFFGNLSLEQIETLTPPLAELALQFIPLQLRLDTVGVFPSIKKPRVIWIGLQGDIDSLQSLKNQLDSVLKKHGFVPDEKKFVPHLTIGRVKEFNRDYELVQRITSFTFSSEIFATVKELIFFKSTLTPHGPHYTAMKTFPFRE